MDGTLSWPLDRAAHLHAERTAVIDGERRLTYRELHARVGGLGAALAELGLAPGGFAGVLAENSLPHLEYWLGAPAHGRVINDLNHRLAVPELAFMVDNSGTEILLTDDTHLETARELRDRCASLRELVYGGTGACPEDCLDHEELLDRPPVPAAELPSETLAAVSYTGGTTGRPKGVMLSHANLLANAKHNMIAAGHQPDDRYLHAAPMFHVADTSQTFCTTWVGGTHVMLPRFEPASFAAAVEEHRVTLIVLVPTMIRMLLDHLDAEPRDMSSLRLLHYAASPIDSALLRRTLDALPCELIQGYGMTEAAPSVAFLTPADHRRTLEDPERYGGLLKSIGTPLPGVQVEVRDAHGTPVAEDEIGELCVRGPNIMLGYWERPEETAAALVDGWYRTGDAGYADASGYLYLVDRMKDMIISGGENVYSVEVERALLEHPAIAEAAVFGIPSERWGETVHAVLVPAAGTVPTQEEIIAHAKGQIAGYKVPRSIEFHPEPLPKSGAGKILKGPLRAPYWEGRERQVG